MNNNIHIAGPVAFMPNAGAVVFFSQSSANGGRYNTHAATATPIKKLNILLEVAPWGEDNRFPQNIENQMAYCGMGKAALDWKARALFGAGITPGRVIDGEGEAEVFQPLKRSSPEGKEIYGFLETANMTRFFLEFFQDWTWFGNCFPEIILDNAAKTITGFCQQESCDSRFKQMNDRAEIDMIYISKLWGMAKGQFAKFDPDKTIRGLIENPVQITEIDNKFLKTLPCIDMYDNVASLQKIAGALKGNGLKSAILPVNYPSPNKTYYQVPAWDGARLGGWVEIACKIPGLIKTMYNKAMRIKYHIEIPATYFEDKFGEDKWLAMTSEEQKQAKVALLKDMEDYLTGSDNAFASFVSFFDYDKHNKTEYGRIKITVIEDKSSIDKDLLTTSAANVEILMAMNVHPSLFSAGAPGSVYRSGGGSGSDIREAFLVYNAMLNLERKVALEPINLARDFNGWDPTIQFKVRDTILTTLDQNSGTKKIVS